MKKITFTVALLLSGTYLLAQGNNSASTQEGNHNIDVIDQVGTGHQSVVNQYSNAANAGQSNTANVKQRNRGGADENSSNIIQRGNSHLSNVDQAGQNTVQVYIGGRPGAAWATANNVGNETSAFQRGTGNTGVQAIYGAEATNTYLELEQRGTGNNSTQFGAWSTNSEGYVQQGTTLFGFEVPGVNNTAWQQIDGDDEYASITQVGNSNLAHQWINGGGSSGNRSEITQLGDNNEARIFTQGNDNVFGLTQTGDQNILKGTGSSEWSNAGEQLGDDNTARFVQTGDGNTFGVSQKGNGNTITGVGLLASLGASQTGNGNIALITQDGDDNLSESRQRGNNNRIDLLQDGFGNQSFVDQRRGALAGGNNNVADISQIGTSHISSVTQNGHNNTSTVSQGNLLP